MTEQLGRIEKSTTERFHGRRKLFLAPIMYEPSGMPEEGQQLLRRYWRQVQGQVANLEVSLGQVRHVFIEALTAGKESGLQQVQNVFPNAYPLVQEAHLNGAALEATEAEDTLLRVMDLQRLLMMPLASDSVARQLHDWYQESVKERWEHIAARIEERLQPDAVGLLLINERHQVQFPPDIQVIYVSPPALDEYRRWLNAWTAQQQQQAAQAQTQGQEQAPEEGADV